MYTLRAALAVTVIVTVTERAFGWGYPGYFPPEHHHHHHHVFHHQHDHHHHTNGWGGGDGWAREGYVYQAPKERLKYPFEREEREKGEREKEREKDRDIRKLKS